MGRPLSQDFFGDLGGRLSCSAYTLRAAGPTACYIVRQRSNLKYEVADETAETAGGFVVDSLYEIATVGNTDFTLIGAPNNDVGTRFTATGVGAGTGTAREIIVAKLQETAPAAVGEMRITVQPESAATLVQAQVSIDTVGGGGEITAVSVANAGYGYWTAGTATVAGGTGGTVDYTVDGNGSIAGFTINVAGTGYSTGAANIGDTPANPPVQYARIINRHQVKCFPQVGGITLAWPAIGGAGSGGRAGFIEGDIETQ